MPDAPERSQSVNILAPLGVTDDMTPELRFTELAGSGQYTIRIDSGEGDNRVTLIDMTLTDVTSTDMTLSTWTMIKVTLFDTLIL